MADNCGGGPGTFCWFLFNSMFMICNSRHEDLHLFWLSFKHCSKPLILIQLRIELYSDSLYGMLTMPQHAAAGNVNRWYECFIDIVVWMFINIWILYMHFVKHIFSTYWKIYLHMNFVYAFCETHIFNLLLKKKQKKTWQYQFQFMYIDILLLTHWDRVTHIICISKLNHQCFR